MSAHPGSDFRFEKRRSEAIVRLSNGDSVTGYFFTGAGSVRHAGQERVGDLLNAETGFFPFEVQRDGGGRVVLFNRAHVVTVTVSSDEPSQDPGYAVARRHEVSMLLSTGQRLTGALRVHRPEGHDRLSDWPKGRDQFHYLETEAFTFIVNGAHIVEVSEVLES